MLLKGFGRILSNCEKITDTGLSHLKNLHISDLNLYDCNNITDDGLVHLINNPIQNLNISTNFRSKLIK